MKKNEIDYIKIRGIVGLFIFMSTLVLLKASTVYGLFLEYKMLFSFIAFIVSIVSLALFIRYVMVYNKT